MNNYEKDWDQLKHKNCIDENIRVYYKIGDNGKI